MEQKATAEEIQHHTSNAKHHLNTNQNTNQGRNFPKNKPAKFTPIPMPYADLLPYLLDNAMAVISLAKTPQPPFPR